MQQKLVPDLFKILVNSLKQPLHARHYFKSKVIWKRIIKKPWTREPHFFFWTQSLSIEKIIKNKSGLELVTSLYSGYKTSFFISYVLTDQVWWCNIKCFLSYSKNYICKFMQTNLRDHKLFHFHLPFWIWKVWKGREKITEIWISWERKKLFR